MPKKLLVICAIGYIALLGLFIQVRVDQGNVQRRLKKAFTFPLATTKAVITSGSQYDGQTLVWDFQENHSYHHDYLAADIHAPEGTEVVAAKGGQVLYVRDVKACDKRHFPAVVIRGQDNLEYYYTHLQPESINTDVGAVVETGQPFAKVGSAACAQGSAPHLHLDISRYWKVNRGSFMSQVLLVDPQPALINAYQGLPEK